MSYEINNEKEWRVSRSGFSIRQGWSDNERIVFEYHGSVAGPKFDSEKYKQWLSDAEYVCDLHNKTIEV